MDSSSSSSNVSRPPLDPRDYPSSFHLFLNPQTPVEKLTPLWKEPSLQYSPILAGFLYHLVHYHPVAHTLALESIHRWTHQIKFHCVQSLSSRSILDWLAEIWQDQSVLFYTLCMNPSTHQRTIVRHTQNLSSQSVFELLTHMSKAQKENLFSAEGGWSEREIYLAKALCLNPNLPQSLRQKLVYFTQKQIQHTQSSQHQVHSSPVHSPQHQDIQVHSSPVHSPQHQDIQVHSSPTQSYQSPKMVSPDPLKSTLRLQYQPIPSHEFPQQLAKFLDPKTPDSLLNLLIDGVVSATPLQRLQALYTLSLTRSHLSHLLDPAITHLVHAFGDSTLLSQLSPSLLDWVSDYFLIDLNSASLDRVSALISLPQTPIITLQRWAQSGSELLCEQLAQNQIRLLNAPELIQALYYNPHCRSSTADRLIELAGREGIDLSWFPQATELIEVLKTEGSTQEHDQHFQVALEESHSQSQNQSDPLKDLKAEMKRKKEEAESEPKEKPLKGYAYIQRLNTAQKIRLALLGSQSDRGFLIKDANKMVARSVIKSPAVSVQEALMYARNHSLNAEIVEYIAKHRKWMQNSQIRFQIVMNPKTPLSISLSTLKTMRLAELKSISQSHGVSGVLSNRAKEMIKKRQA